MQGRLVLWRFAPSSAPISDENTHPNGRKSPCRVSVVWGEDGGGRRTVEQHPPPESWRQLAADGGEEAVAAGTAGRRLGWRDEEEGRGSIISHCFRRTTNPNPTRLIKTSAIVVGSGRVTGPVIWMFHDPQLSLYRVSLTPS